MNAAIRDGRARPSWTEFLGGAGEWDRKPGAAAVVVITGLVLSFLAALVVGLAVTLAFAAVRSAASGSHLVDAITVLTQSPRPGRTLPSYGYEMTVAGLASLAAAGAVLGLAARIYRRPIRSFLTAAPSLRWSGVAAGFAVGFPLVGLAFLGERALDPTPLAAPILAQGASAADKLAYAAMAAVCLYLAAFAEEAIFRGWLLQQTGVWTRNLAIILGVNGLLFSLAHFDPNPTSFLVRAVMGAGWAWIALRTAGVEFTTGAHLANNLFVALFIMPVTFAPPKAGQGGLAPALIELAIVLAMAGIVEAWSRRRPRAARAVG